MKRRLWFSMIMICCCLIAASYNGGESEINKIFRSYELNSSAGSGKAKYLKAFVGDTIILNFPETDALTSFTVHQPDTVWIKKRPKKNPEEGKHFILNKAYKGISRDKSFVTPVEAVNGKPFGVYSVKSHSDYNGSCTITLLDPEDLSLIDLYISDSFPSDFSITSLKANRLIDSLSGATVYYAQERPTSYSDYQFKKCRVSGGEYKVNITGNHGAYSSIPYDLDVSLVLNLLDDEGNLISYYPISKSRYSVYAPLLVSEEQYDAKYRTYEIDSKADLENNEEGDDSGVQDLGGEMFPFRVVPGSTSSYASVYQKINPMEVYVRPAAHLSDATIAITDVLKIGGKEYYKACYNGKAFFIQSKDVPYVDNEKLDSLRAWPQEYKDRFFDYSLLMSKLVYLDTLRKMYEKVASYSRYGLAIIRWSVYDESEYTDGTGIKITFYNPTLTMIKYITITFQGYNAVDDPVGRPVTQKCIGPVYPDETAAYEFEYVWFTDIVEYAKIKTIKVEYKNGTTKTISAPDKIIFDNELRYWFYYSDPVENLK